jgi:hypothetical protein
MQTIYSYDQLQIADVIIKVYLIRGLVPMDPASIIEKYNGIEINWLAITVHIHKLMHLSTTLDPKEYLIPVLNLH